MNKKVILLLLISFCALWSMGQQINITTFRVKSSLPSEITAWAKDPTSVLLVANKIPFQKVDQAKLVLQIKSNGNIICGYQPQELKTRDSSFTLKTFSASDLVSLLGKCENLSPRSYQLSAQFFNAANKSISKESLKTFIVAGNNSAATIPQCTNISISQTASCHGTTASGSPAYATIPPIINNSGQAIVNWTVTSSDVTLLIGGSPVTTYQGIPALLNTGLNNVSAIMFTNPAPMPIYFNYTFTFADGSTCISKVAVDYSPCATPTTCTCNAWPSVIKYGTNPSSSTNPPTYNGTIANNGTITLSANEFLTFPGLVAPGCTGSPCASSLIYEIYNPANTLVISTTGYFDAGTLWEQPCSNIGKYKILIKAKCGTTSCNDFIILINKPCSVPVPCSCGIWKQGKATFTVFNTLHTNSPVDCGKQLTVDCDKPVTITNTITCTGQCPAPAINTYTIYNPNGTINSTGTGTTANFTPGLPTPIPYKVVLKSKCGTQQCDSCVIFVNTKCVAPPICDCSDWEILTVNNKSYKCGDKTAWNCNELVKFSARYNCKPNNSDCPATIKTTVSRDDKIVWEFESGTAPFIDGQFTPTENGKYVITMYPTCNGKPCPPCIITLVVDNCKKCDCKSTQCTKNLWYKDLSTGKTIEFPCNTKTPIVLNCNLNYHFFAETKCLPDTNCKMTVKGEFRNAVGDLVIQQTPFSNTNAFNIISGTPGNYTFIIIFYINDVECSRCSIPIIVKCTPPVCDCGKWAPITVGTNKFKCGEKIPWKCNSSFNFTSQYFCDPANLPNCVASIKWEVKNGTVLVNSGTGTGTVGGSFTPTENGTYIITMIPTCNGKACEPCTFTIVVEDCKPPCNCGKWSGLIVAGSNTPVACNSLITWDCKKPFNFSQSLTCNPNTPNCKGQVLWALKLGGQLIQAGTGTTITSGTFTPTQNGIYTLNFIGTCGGNPCSGCSYKIEVKNCCEDKVVKIFSATGTSIPDNIVCLNPSTAYQFRLSPSAPVVTGTYKIIRLPSGATTPSILFNSNNLISYTVPNYVCGVTEKIRVVFTWGNCTAVLEKSICIPDCCTDIKFNTGNKTINGTDLNFSTTFSTTTSGAVGISKVKVQIMEIYAPSGQTWSNANILTLTTTPSWPGNVSQAITTSGDAIWFPGPGLSANGTFSFNGKIINITPSPNGPVTLKLRYTFYQVNGTCQQFECEKNITL